MHVGRSHQQMGHTGSMQCALLLTQQGVPAIPHEGPWVRLQLYQPVTHLRQLAVLLQLPCKRLLIADSSVLIKGGRHRVQQLNQHQHLQHSRNTNPTNR